MLNPRLISPGLIARIDGLETASGGVVGGVVWATGQ